MLNNEVSASRFQEADKQHKTKQACVISVIRVKVTAGSGTESDPNRIIDEYWSLDGQLLAVYDPILTPCGQQPSQH